MHSAVPPLRALSAALLLATGLALPGCGEGGSAPAAASTSAVGTAPAPPVGDGPRITFDKIVHEFGTVTDTRKYVTSFRFTNTGTDTLVISEVKAACGCTVPTLGRKTFLPGEGDAIEVTFDPSGKQGTTDKYIAVVSNATNGMIRLRISSFIKPLLTFDRFQRLGRLRLGEEARALVLLTYDDPELVITEMSINNPHLTARVAEMGRVASSSYRGAIELTVSKDTPWGVLYATRLEMKVYGRPGLDADPVERDYTVFIQGQVFGQLSAEPSIISVGSVNPNRPYEASATLSREWGAPFRVLGAEVTETNIPGINVRVEPQGPSQARVVVYGSTGGYRGPVKGAVRVNTDVPGEEILTVRFAGLVR